MAERRQLRVQELVRFRESRAGINPAPAFFFVGEGFIPSRSSIVRAYQPVEACVANVSADS
jgi:hypothetical protein